MSEITLVYIAGAKLLIGAVIGFLYALAGRGVGIRRRVALPAILCVTLLLSALVTKTLTPILALAIALTWPVYYLTMSVFSYGADSWIRKLVGRVTQQFIVGGVHGASCILVAIVTARWGVYSLCIICPLSCLGALGGWADSDVNASYKEAIVGAMIFLPALFLT